MPDPTIQQALETFDQLAYSTPNWASSEVARAIDRQSLVLLYLAQEASSDDD